MKTSLIKSILFALSIALVFALSGCGGGGGSGSSTPATSTFPAAWVGTYTGTYIGGGSGTFSTDITAQGAITNCSIVSAQTASTYSCTGTVNSSGSLILTSVSNGAVFSGTVSTGTAGNGQISGTWANSALAINGTFSGSSAVLQSIAVTPATPAVGVGQTSQLTATGTYTDTTTKNITTSVTWASATTSVATVSSSGLASGVAAGTSVITATLGAKSGNTTLTVTTVTLQSIAVTPANPTVGAGQTTQLMATGTYSDTTTKDITASVTWSSGTTAAATVNTAGLVSGVAAGTSVITATSGLISGNTTLTVSAPVTYIYYSLTSSTPQTATLSANGTLSMGSITLTNFVFGSSATDSSGTLTSWASPWNNINQPKVQAMLFCGSNSKLAYVLIQSNTDDPNRSVSTVQNLLGAIEAAPQYSGMGVYTNCSGTFTTAWNNNLPSTNYYLWPNVINTYSYAYVANLLSGAAIFYESGQPSNQDNYLAITWHGGSPFEVWQ